MHKRCNSQLFNITTAIMMTYKYTDYYYKYKLFIVNFNHSHQNPLHIIQNRLSNFSPNYCHFINPFILS